MMTRDEQFKIIEHAEVEILKWSASQGIDLFRVEFVVPFVETDFSLSVWFFYKKQSSVLDNEANSVSDNLKQKFLEVLTQFGYPQAHIAEVDFTFDSNENVEKNYEGSYFYRMR